MSNSQTDATTTAVKTLEQRAREAAERITQSVENRYHSQACHLGPFDFADRLLAIKDGYLAAAKEAEQEIESLRAERKASDDLACATVAEYKRELLEARVETCDKEREIEELWAELDKMKRPLWILKEEHDAEIAALRARVAELEGMVPKWVEWDSDERRNLTKAGAVGVGDDELINGSWHRLMVQPTPLPEDE